MLDPQQKRISVILFILSVISGKSRFFLQQKLLNPIRITVGDSYARFLWKKFVTEFGFSELQANSLYIGRLLLVQQNMEGTEPS